MSIQKLAEKILKFKEAKIKERIKKKAEYRKKFDKIKKKEKEIEEIVDQIEKLYDRWKDKVRRFPKDIADLFSQGFLPKIKDIKAEDVEKVLNQLIERYEDKRYSPITLGLLISLLFNRTVNQYVKEEIEKGKKLEEIKPLNVTLDAKNLKHPLSLLGYENQEKSCLRVMGDVGYWIGYFMEGGKLIINGKAKGFSLSAFSQRNKGEIWYQGKRIWPR
ncbi:MAG: hypothetical protein LWW95_01205 [Candidatus Desulfofervidus auxilii]|nr:hypothetical protein [Candidatus Desulfofervidus auxilii]